MQNDLGYTVRSREIVDLMAAMKNTALTLSPYFQRNLVWRDAHRRDFIDTILKGYPFPQIFLARGPLDVEKMTASQAVVDGQQRLNAIRDFIDGKLDVGGRYFKDLGQKEKEAFLKYEVAVIDFDLDAGDERLKDVFHRLNRTYYALSAIEKIASEYSASEFLLVGRALAGEILREIPAGIEELIEIGDDEGGQEAIPANIFSRDPGIDEQTWTWILDQAEGKFSVLIRAKDIFSAFEFDRKVPLMFTLNVMSTFLVGYYNRNDRVRKFLDDHASEFAEKEEVLAVLNATAGYIDSMNLPDGSAWWNKANFFTLVVELARLPALRGQDPQDAAAKLAGFAQNFPEAYALAAREAVNGKAQRELRGSAVRTLLSVAA
jgi:hypothetical protein